MRNLIYLVYIHTYVSFDLIIWLRVCPQAKSERNYHIFYEMLAGLPPNEKRSLYLQEAETYYYLNQVFTANCRLHNLLTDKNTPHTEHRRGVVVVINLSPRKEWDATFWSCMIHSVKWLMPRWKTHHSTLAMGNYLFHDGFYLSDWSFAHLILNASYNFLLFCLIIFLKPQYKMYSTSYCDSVSLPFLALFLILGYFKSVTL